MFKANTCQNMFIKNSKPISNAVASNTGSYAYAAISVVSSGLPRRPRAFSCKKRGFRPSCGVRRVAETAALLTDEVFPDVPLRQWVIRFPLPLRYLFAAHPQAKGKVLGIIYRAIATHLIHKAGYSLREGATGAVTLIQRFGSALNLNIHFHVLFLDGAYVYRDHRPPLFQRVKAAGKGELEDLLPRAWFS
jgi:hypothetical protein